MEIGDLLEVKIFCRRVTQAGINIRHYNVIAKGGAGVSSTDIAAFLDPIFAPLYKAVLTAEGRYEGVTCQRIRPVPPLVEGISASASGFGTVTGDTLPKQTAGVISLVTEFAGRRYRGRVYVPFPGETDSDSTGAPVAAYVTRLQAIANAFLPIRVITVGINSNQIQSVVFSRVPPETRTPVVGAVAVNIFGTQRRRGDYGRTNDPLV